MNIELDEYGLSDVLEGIKEALANALNTKDKTEQTKYISEAHGMARAMDMLINIKEDDD
jgi:hypothetical protein